MVSPEQKSSALDIFVGQITGNYEMPLYHCASEPSYLELDKNIPSEVRDTIKEIREAKGVEEKVIIAQGFANVYLLPEEETGKGGAIPSFTDIANNPKGDCDVYSRFKAGLLVHGGVPPEDVLLVTGFAQYSSPGHTFEDIHTVTMVRDGNDFHMLDMNMENAPRFDPEYQGAKDETLIFGENDKPAYIENKVTFPFFVVVQNANGELAASQGGMDALNAHGIKMNRFPPDTEPLDISTACPTPPREESPAYGNADLSSTFPVKTPGLR